MSRNQAADAQALYDHRASTYDDSWHPRFARHMVALARLRPGERVLDLACGTGLATIAASQAVGPGGRVVGVDVSSGMLGEAMAKKEADRSLANLEFYQHSITDLEDLSAIRKGSFDVVTCCSALVLLQRPVEALKQWIEYLKPGGRLVVDVTHVQNLTAGVVMERVGRRLGRPLPWYRLNFDADDSLAKAMREAGLVDVKVLCLSQRLHAGSGEDLRDYMQDPNEPRVLSERSAVEADAVFESQVDAVPTKDIASPPEVRDMARELFREEWRAMADANGMVKEVDAVFVGVGFKPKA